MASSSSAAAASSSSAAGLVTVKSVLSGDTVVLLTPSGAPDRLVTLSHLAAPRLNIRHKDADTPDEPFAFASREFLRKMLVGKRVRVRKDWESRHDFGGIFLEGNLNVAFEVVRQGWASVRAVKPDEKNVSPDYDTLMEAQELARSEGLGMWNRDEAAIRNSVRDCCFPDEVTIAGLFEKLKGTTRPACVEGVLAGNLLRVQLRGASQYYIVLVQFTGVQCPSAKSGDNQALALEARAFVEASLLQRDVSIVFEGFERDMLQGSVVSGEKTFSEEVLSKGYGKCADWSISKTTFAPRLRQAEIVARDRRLRLWEGFKAPVVTVPRGVSSSVDGVLLEVFCDRLTVLVGKNKEVDVRLASVRAPKREDPHSLDTVNFLRQFLGKQVHCTFDYDRDPPPQSQSDEKRLFYTVSADGASDIGELMIRQGLANVTRHAAGEPRSRNFDELLMAEEMAKAEKLGVHGGPKPKLRINDLSQRGKSAGAQEKAVEKARNLLDFVGRGPVRAYVEFCLSASRFKLFIPKENAVVIFGLSGIRTPQFSRDGSRGTEEFGEEALLFTKRNLMQREVEVCMDTVDKGAAVVGTLIVKGKSWAVELLKHGLARVFGPAADRSSEGDALYAAEEEARAARKGLWSNPENFEEVSSGLGTRGLALADKQTPIPLRVVSIESPNSFYAHLLDPSKSLAAAVEEKNSVLEEIAAECESAATGVLGHPLKDPKRGSLCLAKYSADGLWYRARILEMERGPPSRGGRSEAIVRFLDYGNVDRSVTAELRSIPQQLADVAVQAELCMLAGTLLPPEDFDATFTLGKSHLTDLLLEVPGVMGTPMYTDKNGTHYMSVTSPAEDGTQDDVASLQLEDGVIRVDAEIADLLPELHRSLSRSEDVAREAHRNIWVYGVFDGGEDY